MTCPLCGAPADAFLTARDRNRAVTDDEFHYACCRGCATVFLADPPDDLGRYYPRDYYDLPDHTRRQLMHAERFKVDLLRRHTEPGPLLEIGTGYGFFARAALDAGFSVTGVEMDARSCERARAELGIEMINSDRPHEVIAERPPSRVVALWHVIEHLPEPYALLDAAAANLQPAGVLALSTPNPHALQFRATRTRWAHLDAPRHLQLIPAATLIARAGRAGLHPVAHVGDDPAGLLCNRMGWNYAAMRDPAHRPDPTAIETVLATAAALAMRPLERAAARASTYTLLLAKPE